MKKQICGLILGTLFCGFGCALQTTAKNASPAAGQPRYTAEADVRGVMQKVERCFDHAFSQFVRNDSPSAIAGRHAFYRRYCIWKFSGIGNLQFVRESSGCLSEEPPLFDNCWEGDFDSAEKGLLPGIFGEPRELLTPRFPLPKKETLFCGAAVLNFRQFQKAQETSLPAGSVSQELSSLFAALAQVPETRLFFELQKRPEQKSRNARDEVVHLCWEMSTEEPAPELFAALSSWALENGEGIVENDRILFSSISGNWILERESDGRLHLHDGHAAPDSQPVQNELTRALVCAPPCSLLLYCAPDAFSNWENALSFLPFSFPFTAELLNGGGVFAFRSEGNRLLLSARMPIDLYGARLLREAFLPMILGEIQMGREILHEASNLQRQANREKCRAALPRYYPLLQRYAQLHEGKFPEHSGAAGLNLIFSADADVSAFRCPRGPKPKDMTKMTDANVPYLYFGGFKTSDNPDFPLLMDCPDRHANLFNVLLLDGRVLTVDLEDPSTARRMIGALQSIYRYSETDLEMLMKKAEELDETPSFAQEEDKEDD